MLSAWCGLHPESKVSVDQVPLIKENWHIYAVVCESGDDNFAVKIGVSSEPHERYRDLLTAIPFKSVMLYSLVGPRKKAYELEKKLHRMFRGRNTRGEWFLFSLEDKAQFHKPVRLMYSAIAGKELVWKKTTQSQMDRRLIPLDPPGVTLKTNWKSCPSQVTIRRKQRGHGKTCGVLK